MVLPAMRQQPHVSFTQIDQYLRCPLKLVSLCGSSLNAWNGEGALVAGILARAPTARAAPERLLDGGQAEIRGQDLPRRGGHDLARWQDAVVNQHVDDVARDAEFGRGVYDREISAVSHG